MTINHLQWTEYRTLHHSFTNTYHIRPNHISQWAQISSVLLASYCKLFVSDNTICELVTNTNLYAEKENTWMATSHTWHVTHEGGLKVWLAIIIYMRLHWNSSKTPQPNLYWDPEFAWAKKKKHLLQMHKLHVGTGISIPYALFLLMVYYVRPLRPIRHNRLRVLFYILHHLVPPNKPFTVHSTQHTSPGLIPS